MEIIFIFSGVLILIGLYILLWSLHMLRNPEKFINTRYGSGFPFLRIRNSYNPGPKKTPLEMTQGNQEEAKKIIKSWAHIGIIGSIIFFVSALAFVGQYIFNIGFFG